MIQNYFKKFGALFFPLLSLSLFLIFSGTIKANNVSVQLLPAPPENAEAVQNTPTEIELSWDASPSNPAFIDNYTIFYKLHSTPSYPLTPQITVPATLASYSQVITVTEGQAYDFIIFANTSNAIPSTEDCESCKATTAVVICGNDFIDVGEQCDGTDLSGSICTDFGYTGGTLSCSGSCTFDFSACTSAPPPPGEEGPGSGGGGTSANTKNPSAGIASSPTYANTSPILVKYDGVENGLSSVTLYYKKGLGAWTNSGLISDHAPSGTFNFAPPNDLNGVYYFALQVKDQQGNLSLFPSEEGDTSTLFDTTSPTIGSITLPKQAVGPISIAYKDALDPASSGLKTVELWVKKGETGLWENTFLIKDDPEAEFIFNDFTDSGAYYFDLIAIDQAGNKSTEMKETQNPVIYDPKAPIFDNLQAGKIENHLIPLTYNGAQDVGPAGLKSVELWSKKEADGVWTSSDLKSSKSTDTFNFPLLTAGTYYFDLVLQDNFGNQSPPPEAEGSLIVVVGKGVSQVTLSNLPPPLTDSNEANIGVSGQNILSYKYKLNDSEYSEEIPIDTPISLSSLPDGEYQLAVIAKDSNGIWQDPSQATTYTWVVSASTPQILISGPFISSQEPNQVTYQVVYEAGSTEDGFELNLEDVELKTTGTAVGELSLSQDDEKTWTVTIDNISGLGEMSIILSPQMVDINGKPMTVVISQPFLTTALLQEQDLENVIDLFKKVKTTIIPASPLIDYSVFELQQKAIEAINQIPRVSGISFADVFPNISGDRISFCKKEYKNLDFDSLSLDTDSDGLSNRTECYLTTNPLLADTDQDQCADGDEINLLGLNPLNPADCPFANGQKNVWITSPQNEWLISRLEITGLTPDDTSTVSLFAFPVEDGKANADNSLILGKIEQFNPSNFKGHYFFELKPQTLLKQGQTYDLLAVTVLSGGKTLSSPPVRFTFDERATAHTPTPLTIGEISIPRGLKLTNVHISQTEDGKVKVTGESEYGAQVFAVWQSVVLASSVITDSELGSFTIESPSALEPDQTHKVTLYAVKHEEKQTLRSPNVEVNFYLHSLPWIYYLLMIVLLKVILLIIITMLIKHDKKLILVKS